MTPDRWERVKELFDAVLETSPEKRPKFLADACAGDDVLCGEIERLIAEHDRTGEFLDSPLLSNTGEPPHSAGSLRYAFDEVSADPDSSVYLIRRGETFASRYEIRGELGRGGFGIVYAAFDQGPLQRTVALKLIRVPTVKLSEEASHARQRFLEEGRVAGNLSHSNIATVFDVGECGECVYMTQELASGRDLRKILAEAGPLPMGRIFAIARQICEGLAHAHGRAIVHRDIKPGNIVVSGEDRVKITDFGLAQPPQSEDPTLHQAIAGTPGYMAPEQLRGERVDGRADIFAVGCVLYQMLTGRAPFEGATVASVIEKTLYTFPPAPSRVREDLPHTLDRVVARAMRKDPDDRYNNVTQLQQDLLNHETFGYVIDADVGANKIASALEARQCTLFIGLCLPVSLNEKHATTTVESLIADYLAERLSSPSNERSLSRLAQDLEIERGRQEMLKYLTAAVRNPSVSPREIIGRIARLRFPVVVTTGYDTFLEEELARVDGKVRRVLNGRSIPDDATEADLLVRLFGSLESEPSIVVTEDDLWKFFGAFNSLSSTLKSRFARHCLLFVGFDPEDEGFRHLFAEIARFREGATDECLLAFADTAIPAVRWAQNKGLKLIDAQPASFLSLVEETVTEKRRQKRSAAEEISETPLPSRPYKIIHFLRRLVPGAGHGIETPGLEKGGPEHIIKPRSFHVWLRAVQEHLPAQVRPFYIWLGTVAVALVLVLAVGASFWPRAPRLAKPLSPVPALGVVRLEISPWGKLKEIRNLRTHRIENCPDQITPAEVTLPAGDYEVMLEHPALGTMQLKLHVEAGKQQEIQKSFPKFDPEQVLKGYH